MATILSGQCGGSHCPTAKRNGVYNLLDMLRAEFVLGLDLFKLFAGINEQAIIVFLTAFLQYENTGRNACTIENIGTVSYTHIETENRIKTISL